MEKKNYMKEVASLLGVELDEHFKIIDENGIISRKEYVLSEDGASEYDGIWTEEESGEVMHQYYNNVSVLTYLLTGRYKIQKIPFKPKSEQEYWSLYKDENDNIIAGCDIWLNYTNDYIRYNSGLCFRTKEEAEANKDKLQNIINYYNGEED